MVFGNPKLAIPIINIHNFLNWHNTTVIYLILSGNIGVIVRETLIGVEILYINSLRRQAKPEKKKFR